MKTFLSYIIEAKAKIGGSSNNTAMGNAYEAATVLHIHNNTAAANNDDDEYQRHIAEVKKTHKENMDKLPPEAREDVEKKARDSAEAYLNSLEKNHGIKRNQITRVHHTNQGIDKSIGKTVDRGNNPHDLIVHADNVKTKDGGHFVHGASLKATSGTASNNTVNAFDQKAGIKTKLNDIWKKGLKRAGLEGKSGAEIKAVRDNPKIKKINSETQAAAASHHGETFNNLSHKEKQKHLQYLLKGKPDLPYDYVKGEKGGSATPQANMSHFKAITNAKKLKATVSGNLVHFHDEKGNHIATVEHRTTHGAFGSPQVNAKFGNIKELKE